MSDTIRIIVILLLVLGNAVFVAAEYALVTARRARLEELARNGSKRAETALQLLDEPVRFISTVQVGITVFSILLGADRRAAALATSSTRGSRRPSRSSSRSSSSPI